MDPLELERLVDRELRRLPPPRAPRTLLPRVLAAAEALRRRPWYTREWLAWPVGWQVASLVAFVAAVAGMSIAGPAIWAGASSLGPVAAAGGVARDLLEGVETLSAATSAVRAVWSALVGPFAIYLIALAGLLSLTCAAFGIALERVASGRALLS